MSTKPHILNTLDDISDNYDAVLCDVWGVLHNGRAAFDDAVQALSRFRQAGGFVVLLTNAPRPMFEIPPQLRSLGVPDSTWDDIVTSGDATRALMMARAPGPVFALGPTKDARLYDGTGLAFGSLQEATFISCTGFDDDTHQTPDDYSALLQEARALDLPMICANPDIMVHLGDKLIYCGGALAKAYADLGGTVAFAGKPHAPIYQLAFDKIAQLAGKPTERARILAIGDGLPTDIAGAQAMGLDCLFITGGLHQEHFQNGLDAGAVAKLLAAHKTCARYALDTLR